MTKNTKYIRKYELDNIKYSFSCSEDKHGLCDHNVVCTVLAVESCHISPPNQKGNTHFILLKEK